MNPRDVEGTVAERKPQALADKKMINVRLSQSVWNQAKAAASERGMTLERWVTEALLAHVGRQSRVGASGEDPLVGLTWRVSALEEAVDYLAGAIGAPLPGGETADSRVG